VRDIDLESQEVLRDPASFPFSTRVLLVDEPGLVPALNVALDACRTDFLAFLDDDAIPHPEWSMRLMNHFVDHPRLGGVGGKDRLYDGLRLVEGRAAVVAKVFWFGRVLPNHHLGYGAPRPVDMLKGTNMCFRAAAFANVRFDTRLRGIGIQTNHDLAFSQAIKNRGWEILYDPAILVDHFTNSRGRPRHYVDIIRVIDKQGFRDWSFNEVVALWDVMPLWRRISFVAWSFLVGTRVCPGLVQAIRFTPRLGAASWQRFILAQQGKLEAFRSLSWRNRSPPGVDG